MSDPQEDEGDMPDDTDPSRSGVSEGNRHGEGDAVVADRDGDGETRKKTQTISSTQAKVPSSPAPLLTRSL